MWYSEKCRKTTQLAGHPTPAIYVDFRLMTKIYIMGQSRLCGLSDKTQNIHNQKNALVWFLGSWAKST